MLHSLRDEYDSPESLLDFEHFQAFLCDVDWGQGDFVESLEQYQEYLEGFEYAGFHFRPLRAFSWQELGNPVGILRRIGQCLFSERDGFNAEAFIRAFADFFTDSYHFQPSECNLFVMNKIHVVILCDRGLFEFIEPSTL